MKVNRGNFCPNGKIVVLVVDLKIKVLAVGNKPIINHFLWVELNWPNAMKPLVEGRLTLAQWTGTHIRAC